MIELEVGKQYKTRGGYRAFVVAGPDRDDEFTVWHEFDEDIKWHRSDGVTRYEHDADIIEKWGGPLRGECWLNFYEGSAPTLHITKQDSDNVKDYKRIANVKVTWTEGQFEE